MKTVQVTLSQKPYPIIVSRELDWVSSLTALLPDSKAVLMTNPRLKKLCLSKISGSLKKIKIQTIVVPDGEQSKNLKTVSSIYKQLIQKNADRQTPVILLGGGVLGDMGGFAAATFLRGIPFIQIPTTLVAQVDSSIGGKLGIDLPEGKNLVGVFEQPRAVFSYVPFLKTLPSRELLGGLGEVLKYGLIREPNLFEITLKEKEKIFSRNFSILEDIVYRSSVIKADVVSRDEKESKLRMILNFGHTFGHALEKLTHYRRFLHGEAVGIGMSIAAEISHRLGFCSLEDKNEIIHGLQHMGFSLEVPRFKKSDWIKALKVDKKSRGGMIHFVFLKKIGDVVTQPISAEELVKTTTQI